MIRARSIRALVAGVVLVGAWATGPAAAQQASLATSATVDRPTIRLGDIFHGVDAKADAPVASAPRPGRAIRFSASRLERIAQTHGVAWEAPSRASSLTVRRAVQRVGEDAIKAAVSDALAARGADGNSSVILSNSGLMLELPTDVPGTVAVADLSYRADSGRFSATVKAPAAGEALARATVTGRVVRMLEVPVPVERIPRGTLIDEGDLKWISLPSDRLRRNQLTDADDIVGKSARRPLQAGEPLRDTAIEAPKLVERNALVTLRLDTRRMTLTAQGRALEDGAKGELVRVINTSSKTTVTGVVAGNNLITVQPTQAARN